MTTLRRLKAEAEDARLRLEQSTHELIHALAPSTIVKHATEDAKAKAVALGNDAAEVTRERPLAVGGAAGALAGLLIWRRVRSRKRQEPQAVDTRSTLPPTPIEEAINGAGRV